MGKFIVEKDGVKNTIIADIEFVSTNYPIFTEIIEDVIIQNNIPQEIRMAQCRAQLIIEGKDDDVELLMTSITDPIQQKLYRAYFEYEPIVKRDNVMINEMAPALTIDLDTFFINASKL